jgi:hypothetical protein
MEEHPVPHNVLEIEFKLFGNFSVRQFVKMMAGAAIALAVFVLQLPSIVAIPIIVVSIGYGIGSAMIPEFDRKANTIIGAIFVSPRYVWKRTPVSPEYLTRDYEQNVVNSKASVTNTKGVKVNESELEQILTLRSQRKNLPTGLMADTPLSKTVESEDFVDFHPGSVTAENFDQYYMQAFGAVQPKVVEQKPKPVQMPNPAPAHINNLAEATTTTTSSPNALYGIAVDRKDQPIAAAEITVLNQDQKEIEQCTTGDDGRFTTQNKLPAGEYYVKLKKSGYKFEEFKITITSGNLPAFRFRAK